MLSRNQWAVVILLGAVALALNLWSWQLHGDLREELISRYAAAGSQLQPIKVFDLEAPANSEPKIESFQASTRQLLFLLSPSCSFCLSNLGNWQELEVHLDPERIRLVAITKRGGADLQPYRDALRVPILLAGDREELSANRLITTPQTLLLDPSGKVIHNWVGDLSEHRDSVQEVLGIRLSPEPVLQ